MTEQTEREGVEQLAERMIAVANAGQRPEYVRGRYIMLLCELLQSVGIDPATMQPMDSGEKVNHDAHRGATSLAQDAKRVAAELIEASGLVERLEFECTNWEHMCLNEQRKMAEASEENKVLRQQLAALTNPTPAQPANDVEREIVNAVIIECEREIKRGLPPACAIHEGTRIATEKLKPLRDDYERVKAELERVRSNQRIDIACLKECKKQLAEAREALAEIQDEHQHLAELQQQLVESRERVNLLEKIQANTLSHTRDIVKRLKGQMMVLANPQPANAEGASR